MPDIESLMSTAQKYLVEMNYEQAIAEFEKIIELEPNNAEAYLGLAQAYRDSGDIDKAAEVLKKGYDITGDERLKDMIDVLLEGHAEEVTEITSESIETETETAVDDKYTIMPDLIGLTEEEAIRLCEENNIQYEIGYGDINNINDKIGVVVSQSRDPGSKILKDNSYSFTVSQEYKIKEIPKRNYRFQPSAYEVGIGEMGFQEAGKKC